MKSKKNKSDNLIVSKIKNSRISTRKVGLIVKDIRRKKIDEATAFLEFNPKKGSKIVLKLLKSAIANAANNYGVKDSNTLVINRIDVGPGVTLKRARFQARGKYHRILKRTSNVTVVLENLDVVPSKKAKPKKEGGKSE